MRWTLSHHFDPDVLPLADRHYNRQKPGSPQFAPPGRCVVLKLIERGACTAFWITSHPLYHQSEYEGAWFCSAFRNESDHLSSELIREALAATQGCWGIAPSLGCVTYVNAAKVRHKRDPGRCFLKAGFERVGTSGKGLVILQLLPDAMPEPALPLREQPELFEASL